jgi:glycosyltransferase involved in cell wall biosynthesis
LNSAALQTPRCISTTRSPRVRREVRGQADAGREDTPGNPAPGDDRVVVTGQVGIRDIQRAAVVVLPLRVGAGTKHRVFQALAMEKPLVTTSVGAEGIALEHGTTAMIADDPEQFAAHTVALLKNPGLRLALGKAGRELVVTRYDWRANYATLESVFQQAVAKRRT